MSQPNPVLFRPIVRSLAFAAAALGAAAAGADLPIAPKRPPAAIVNIESDDQLADVTSAGGSVVFARTAAPVEGASDGWWLRLDVTIENQGSAALEVTGFVVDTDVTTPENVALEDAVSIPAHSTRVIKVPAGFGTSGPMPHTLGVRAELAGYAQPIERVVDLIEYVSPTPSGGYAFPARAQDLPPGVYWSVGAHAHSLSQRYAYDFGNRRWDDEQGEWVGYTSAAKEREADGGAAAGTQNPDFLIWERPVYALADATIVRCHRSRPDNVPGQTVGGGGNGVILDMGDGTFVAYYHLRQFSVPAALCPVEGAVGADQTPLSIPVVSGQLLGAVGNTGHSTGPHLHLQLSDHAGPDEPAQRGLPLRFHSIAVHERDGYDPTVDLSGWNDLTSSESAVPTHVLIQPPCGGPGCAFAPPRR